MGLFRSIVFLVVLTWLGCSPALADKRVALVIGNSDYQKVAKLANPANDAAAVAAMFKAAGFDVVDSRLNISANDLRKTLREFGDASRDADVAVVYYAGHGIELDGTNYLIPVDATLQTDAEVLDETIPLDRVLFAVEPAKKLRLVILDACRDNPFARTMKRTMASRAIGRGLAKIEPTSPNTMIAFAAKAGSTASDGDSKNSPFAAALIEYLPKPGLDLRRAFGFVRDDVLKVTGNKQEPYVYGSLGGDDLPLVAAKPPVVTAPQADPQASVRRDYELALQAGDRDAWEAFLQTYPEGFYANLAKVQLKKIAAEEIRAAAAEKARQAEQEKARLAAEGAKKAEQEKAAAAAKAAELARLAAEKVKQIEQAKAADAEQARAAAEKAAADRTAVEAQSQESKPLQQSALAAAVPSVKSEPETQVALLTPPTEPASKPVSDGGDLVKQIKKELQRVGCYTGAIDDKWVTAKASLGRFIKFAKISAVFERPESNLLDAIRGRNERVCPLECAAREVESNGQCIARTCPAGLVLGDDGSCEKPRAKSAARSQQVDNAGKKAGSARAKPASRREPLGNATKESEAVLPAGSIRSGQVMTVVGRNGRKMTCTGGDNARNIPRSCVWN